MENGSYLLIICGIITSVISLEIIPVQNNILPFSLGKAYISQGNLQLIYHIDLNKIESLVKVFQKQIEAYDSKRMSNKATFANFWYLKQEHNNNVEKLEEILNEKIRIKRGLIDLGGKISKILFGTLDSDDEELYKSYFDTIQKNENVLMRNQKQLATVLNDLKGKYQEKIRLLTDNIKLFGAIPEVQQIQQMHLLLFHINDIHDLLNEIQVSISFARLHLLHESILPYSKFVEIVKNVTIIPLHHLKDYYQLCNTKIIFKNKVLLFLISIPLVDKQNYDLYKFYYLPQNNLTLSYSHPYLLSREGEIKWSTAECHPVEREYLCDQNSLIESPPCLRNLLKNHVENCTKIPINQPSDLKVLEDGNVLSINNDKIQEVCPHQTKYYFTPSTAILKSRCPINNMKKEILPTTTLNEERFIVLPKTLSPQSYMDDVQKKEEEAFPDVTLETLNKWNVKRKTSYFLYLIIFIIFITIVLIIYFKYFMKATPQGDTFHLGGEELHVLPSVL